ncbi:DUF4402 domain-containing protein [Sphingomonas lutea]|uniref:DUF4402 domain-containing protein n=1 Tax=Sphingomonas lutea TaxID=1045317 RepID=A0A7G9SIJ2_9SPHN|nr:DUF4402 domain-containing protein [Sphingomonas lutea]QNN67667.1 DUF4402 domain-containing protein [Sphingomonas lutea]
MANLIRLLMVSAAVAVLAVPLKRADAQCRLCDTPVTARDGSGEGAPVALEIETSLSFDRLVLLGDGEGSAVIRPDGTTSALGMIGQVGPRAMVGSAIVRGEPNRVVRVDLPRQITLHSAAGNAIGFDEMVSDLPAVPRLDSTGTLRFRFGGRLHIRGEAEGEYRGDLPITVEYP